ncbi:uncharacterized protein LOC144918226 isoform X1 [Branchiostoma floridae x Branchiostoma belcheri]
MKRSGHLVCTFGFNRVLQFVVLMSVCWTYQDSRVEATTTCDCAADCVSYCTAEPPVGQATCPAGYQRFQENCFKAFPQTEPDNTWAMKACLKDEGFLAMPKDAATNACLVQLKNAVRNDAGFYIGLSDQNAEGEWHFADGTALGSYNNWNPGEPNNRGNEDCATLLPGYGGKWNVVPCSSDRRYICQVTPIHPGCSQKATDTTYMYRWDLPQLTGTRFTFQVSAYKAAFIGLSPENHDVTDMYEIVIGLWSNTKSAIRRGKRGENHALVSTPGIISATEYRTFWINLAPDGTVSVGKGGDAQPFMSWRDPNPIRVYYAGYSTGWGATGRWKFCSNEAHLPPQVQVTANPNSSCPVAVGNPSPAALIAVSVVAGVAIVLAVAASILYIGKRLELRKFHSDQPLLGRDASYRSIPGHQYETIPGTVRGPLPIPAARVPPAVRHTDIELHGEGEGGRKRRHQMTKDTRGGPRDTNAGGPIGGMHHSPRPGGTRYV